MLNLLLVIHNHQPLGNLPDVFRKAYDIAYKPFLDVVRRHPKISWALHTSGCLWEWLEREEPGYLDALREEQAAGRLEFVTGAMWEPIQPIISEQSFHKHYDLMRKYLGEKFGVGPVGCWTTERVWEPNLAGRLSDQGIRYTFLDDSQLRAGLPSPDEHPVWGYYQTEHNGKSVNIFPIDEKLRYMIPFRKADEVISHLEKLADDLPDNASVTYGDDGEKFGLWPETFEWVYKKGWLDDFLGRLEKSKKIVTTHPSKYIKIMPLPRQRVYIPTSSYREMGIWSLYPKRSLAADKIHHWVESNDELRQIEPPHAAGFFRNYLSKYPESRYMHERVQEIIETILEKAGPDVAASSEIKASNAQKALWHALRAQCNCPYWHGVFGGLYLNYLRFAINREILHAEGYLREYLDSFVRKIGTVHLSGVGGRKVRESDSVILLCQNPIVQWGIDPVTGQVISAGSVEKKVDVIDVIARRFEAYHATMKDADDSGAASQPASIHDIQEIAPKGWRDDFGYDPCRRGCFGVRFNEGQSRMGPESGPWSVDAGSETLILERHSGQIVQNKTFTSLTNEPVLKMAHSMKSLDGFHLTGDFEIEFNLGLLAGNASDRYIRLSDGKKFPLETKLDHIDGSAIDVIDEWTGVRVRLDVPDSKKIKTYPVKTLSRGEGGLELNYQGVCIVFRCPIDLGMSESHRIEASMGIYSL